MPQQWPFLHLLLCLLSSYGLWGLLCVRVISLPECFPASGSLRHFSIFYGFRDKTVEECGPHCTHGLGWSALQSVIPRVPSVSLLVLSFYLFFFTGLFLSPFLSIPWSFILLGFKFIMSCPRYELCWLPQRGAGWRAESTVCSWRDLWIQNSGFHSGGGVFLAQSSKKDREVFSGSSIRKCGDQWEIMVLYVISL